MHACVPVCGVMLDYHITASVKTLARLKDDECVKISVCVCLCVCVCVCVSDMVASYSVFFLFIFVFRIKKFFLFF